MCFWKCLKLPYGLIFCSTENRIGGRPPSQYAINGGLKNIIVNFIVFFKRVQNKINYMVHNLNLRFLLQNHLIINFLHYLVSAACLLTLFVQVR